MRSCNSKKEISSGSLCLRSKFNALLLITVLSFSLSSCSRNENPPEISDQVFSLDENSPLGTIIGTVSASDLEDNGTIGFSILDGNTNSTFSLAENTGVLTVNNPAALDYEKTREFTLIIQVTDHHPKEPMISKANIKILINDLNEFAPEIADHYFQIDEFPKEDTLIGKLTALDDDLEQTLTFSIESGNDQQALRIDSLTGEIYVANPSQFDRSIHHSIKCMIAVSDNYPDRPKTDQSLLTINIVENNFSFIGIRGTVQKGPYILGSQITVHELNASLEPTGKTYSTNIRDNSGAFALEDITLQSRYVQLVANGYYFNERSGNLSEAQLTLYCIADLVNQDYININILTHMEYERLKFLIQQDFSFFDAKNRAHQDVLSIFNIPNSRINAERMDISETGDDHAKLLAASVISQGAHTTAEFSELINRISLDIREDGVLDNNSLGSELVNSVNYANLAVVRNNLETRYSELSVDYTIPDFEKYISQFLQNTDFVATNAFIFPSMGDMGVNCLHPDTLIVYDQNLEIVQDYSVCVDVPENRKLTFTIQGYGLLVYTLKNKNMVYEKTATEPDFFTFQTTAEGRCEYKVAFKYYGHYPAINKKTLHFDYYAEDSNQPFYSKDIQLITDYTPPADTTNRK